MASSTVAASTLTRPRAAVAIASAVASVILGYYCYRQYQSIEQELGASGNGPSLHRRNALRRPRRASQRRGESSGSESPGDENENENENENATENVTENVAENRTTGNIFGTVPDLASASAPVQVSVEQAQAPPTLEWYDDTSALPRQRTGENIVTLLFRVSEDNARRNAYVHRGCLCNGCGMLPIRGIRYRCANCADFDLCEACESQGMHNKTHVFYKVKIPVPSSVARHVQPPWYPGDPDSFMRNLPRYLLARWSHETGFERVELEALWEQWTFMANTEWREDPLQLGLAMDRKTFERCLVPSAGYRHPAPNLIHDRMFAFYDTNHDDLISFEEFLHGVSYKKQKTKLKRIFDGYDIDGDGYVSRRDFLRMFRAYYVCYKQMHQDTVLGLDDYMMTTVEAQQLVNSRQPLSSLFGREGRVPDADHGRPMEGKIYRSREDVEVYDGMGAVSQDRPDISSREDILRELFTRSNTNQSLFTESFGPMSNRPTSTSGGSQYVAGILDPPQNLVDLTSLLTGHHPHLDDILDSIRSREQGLAVDDDTETGSSDEDGQSTPDDQMDYGGEVNGNGNAAPSPEIPDAAQFLNTFSPGIPSQFRPEPFARGQRINMDKRKRILARKMLYERWKRRQFYLDEEEGASPPEGWRDEQDILANLDKIPESSKSAAPLLSPRSRSSSKVRFAEDTDDFETRSNHSTSSRSVPERWGGMDIPDAERDAGKEILYQVAQQAFNELLDGVFKKKEDLAFQAAETKEYRDRYRHHLDGLEVPVHEMNECANEENPAQPIFPDSNTSRPVQEQSLEDLLASSGYAISDQRTEASESRARHDQQNSQNGQAEDAKSAEDEKSYRDPTMPQFRPNSDPQDPNASEDQEPSSNTPRAKGGQRGPSSDGESRTVRPDTPGPISRQRLITWKILDLAEKEAKERGGWGRLSYTEFEEIYREHEFSDGLKNRLAYLGSWIDFCIPS